MRDELKRSAGFLILNPSACIRILTSHGNRANERAHLNPREHFIIAIKDLYELRAIARAPVFNGAHRGDAHERAARAAQTRPVLVE